MGVEFDDIITISFIERCDGKVLTTNIEEIARNNGIYDENSKYVPIAMNVGNDIFPEALHNELIGKEGGAKGTVILPPEEAYGERHNDNIYSINKKKLKKIPKIGDIISDPTYGDGIVVNKIGSEFIIDCNHKYAGKEVEYEYEIHEIITDPYEQFFRIVDRLRDRLGTCEYETSFENGNGIISATIPTKTMLAWDVEKGAFVEDLFFLHSSLDILEFREEYENIFHTEVRGEADDATESEEIKTGDLIIFNSIKRFDGEIFKTTIEQVARDNDLYTEGREYTPDFLTIGLKPTLGVLEGDIIGKKVGSKGIVIIPPEEAYGIRSKEKVQKIDQKEFSKDTRVGSYIDHQKYGNGVAVNKIGRHFVVDFNHPLAGKDIECEYEILERITDPAEKFYRLLRELGSKKYDASFENGKGIISVEISLFSSDMWSVIKTELTFELFMNLPFLRTLEFHEKYGDDFNESLLYLLKSDKKVQMSLKRIQELQNSVQ